MNSDRWKVLMAVLGVASIVASLVFVGLQIRQSTELTEAAQYQARAEDSMDLYVATLQAGFDWSSRLGDDGDRSKAEIIANLNINLWTWTSYENQHFQYESGFLTEDAWVSLKNRIRELVATSDGRASFEHLRLNMRTSFVETVERLADETK